MKNKKLLLFGLGVAVAGSAFLLVPSWTGTDSSTVLSKKEKGEKKGIDGALEFYMNIKKNPATGRIDVEDVLKAEEEVAKALKRSNSRTAAAVNWIEMGPSNVGGRTRAILFDKNDNNKIFAGGVAGGLWKSTNGGQSWTKVFDQMDNIAVSAIAQGPNGDIYVGTGEGLYAQYGTGAGGVIGKGVYKSTDGGSSFTVLPSTVPSSSNSNIAAWAAVNELAVNPLNSQRVYAATNKGLQISDDGGATWIGAFTLGSFSADVDVASDGTVIASIGSGVYMSSTGNPGSFVVITSNGADSLPKSQARYESVFAASDPNYIYCSVASSNGSTKGIYRSVNKGSTWQVIGPGGSSTFNPLGQQGSFANAIAVDPNDKNRILVGGLDLYSWSASTTWTKLSRWYTYSADPKYVHADIHDIKFHPTLANTFYIGNDGGVFRSTDGGTSFYNRNQGYNVTQFYSVAFSNLGEVLGGTQDNGTQYIPTFGTGSQVAYEITGGDGGQAEISYLNEEVTFQTVYYGQLTRRPTRMSGAGSEFFSARIQNLTISGAGIGSPGFASFVTPIRLWESANDSLNITDSVNFIADRDYLAGELIAPKSRTSNLPLSYTLSSNLDSGQTIRVRDYIQTKFAYGITNSVYLTKGALDFSTTPGWARVASSSVAKPSAFLGTVQCFAFSNDGDHLFVGTESGRVYRISNLSTISATDTLTGEIGNVRSQVTCTQIGAASGSRAVTSISVDPRNSDNVIVTFGNYGQTAYVYRHTSATTAAVSGTLASWTSVQGTTNALPTIPTYSSVIDYLTGTVLVGTEYGVWSSEDALTSATPTWVAQNTGFPTVPVFALRQQTHTDWFVNNTGVIYAGTHGRGVWRTNSFVGIRDNAPEVKSTVSVTVFPNPVVESATLSFTAKQKGEAMIRIFSLNGRLVYERTMKDVQAGKNIWSLETDQFANGTYIVKVSGASEGTSKFIVIK